MPDPQITPSSLAPRPGYEWTDEDIDAAGRAGDMAAMACSDAQALANGFARDGWQTVIDFADGARRELFDLLCRVATPAERPDESVSAEFFARLDAMTGEIERLRAENARLRDPFLWTATWYTRYVADGRTEDVVLDHGNLIELDHGIGQILFTHPDLGVDRD